jgi:hypothetical protein
MQELRTKYRTGLIEPWYLALGLMRSSSRARGHSSLVKIQSLSRALVGLQQTHEM